MNLLGGQYGRSSDTPPSLGHQNIGGDLEQRQQDTESMWKTVKHNGSKPMPGLSSHYDSLSDPCNPAAVCGKYAALESMPVAVAIF
ncbi:MAG: hypothetical protein LBV45_00445 [Xanthomonadaceae bacterium]|jgi:hypothetical protein|nr:hypothetical protein [Xanthomonadaceae bacterium]